MTCEKPEYFTKEWYIKQKRKRRTDMLLAEELEIDVTTLRKWKREMKIASREFGVNRICDIPDFFTQSWYDEQKKMHKKDEEIAKELFVGRFTLTRWKKREEDRPGKVNSEYYKKRGDRVNWYITSDDEEKAEKNGISRTLLHFRVNQMGWDIEKAVNTPVKKSRPRGSLNKYAALAKENGIAYKTMLERINRMGWEPLEAATKPLETLEEKRERQSKFAEKQRKHPKEMVELAKKNGIGYQTFRLRVKAGKSYEEAATRPLRYESKI